MHTTNYFDTFILAAEDCNCETGVTPPLRSAGKTIATMEHEIIQNSPYRYTSDEVKFMVYALRNKIADSDMKQARSDYFSKGQPCFRASPLTKTYGWGIHCNSEEKMALYGVNSKEYRQYSSDASITTVKAMRSRKTQ